MFGTAANPGLLAIEYYRCGSDLLQLPIELFKLDLEQCSIEHTSYIRAFLNNSYFVDDSLTSTNEFTILNQH